jgi:ferredoxin-NADP reductase
MAKALEYNATIVKRVDLTEALAIFWIEPDRPPQKRPWFNAGQYCVIGLNALANPDFGPVRRAMSIASPPEDDGPIEFYIRRVAKPESKHPLTHLLWALHEGDRIYLRAVAAGVFTITDTVGIDDQRFRVMVAAGTGVAPFVSMIRSEVRRDSHADLSRYAVLHGASHAPELGYRREFLALATTNGLKYWGTVSRPGEASDWLGDVGRVESFFEPGRLSEFEQRLGLPPEGLTPDNAVIYICGLTGTISATFLRLIDRGFIPDVNAIRDALGVPPEARHSLFFEHYDTEPVIDIRDPAIVQPLRARAQAALSKLRDRR